MDKLNVGTKEYACQDTTWDTQDMNQIYRLPPPLPYPHIAGLHSCDLRCSEGRNVRTPLTFLAHPTNTAWNTHSKTHLEQDGSAAIFRDDHHRPFCHTLRHTLPALRHTLHHSHKFYRHLEFLTRQTRWRSTKTAWVMRLCHTTCHHLSALGTTPSFPVSRSILHTGVACTVIPFRSFRRIAAFLSTPSPWALLEHTTLHVYHTLPLHTGFPRENLSDIS